MYQRLTLTSDSPLRTFLLDEQDMPQYKISTPRPDLSATTTVARYTNGYEEESAKIEWHSTRDTRLFYQGRIVNTKDFFKPSGFFRTRVGRDTKFKAPDGREYKWSTHRRGMDLIQRDQPTNVLASFKEQSINLFSPSSNAYLDIYPAGQHMIDLIITTFVYVEHTRREGDRRSSNMAMMGAMNQVNMRGGAGGF
ncbi:hypothetical protein JAAARDRAFT_196223 [Jaapia argillacea MUCL 33604]|uniref:DUF6593 domain-containing protein n=1 Tax=Jaapia argillacea MUCL 33604 TaxID=933084 RepID=A0A067PLW3_9AGAM|nr:hypothetical protein JAAARDRAFT_196223 [Jaapia argillacea MUCL 33604]